METVNKKISVSTVKLKTTWTKEMVFDLMTFDIVASPGFSESIIKNNDVIERRNRFIKKLNQA